MPLASTAPVNLQIHVCISAKIQSICLLILTYKIIV